IWLACDNGVYVFNPDAQIFSTYNLQRPDEQKARELAVQAVTELTDGRIAVGCWGAGMFLFDQKLNPLPLPPALQVRGKQFSVWDMNVHSRTGNLWIAQQGGILSVYDPKKDKLTDLAPEVFGASTIRQLDEDTSGNFWFGTQSGKLIKWDMKAAGNDPSKGYTVAAQMERIIKVHFDYAGFVWAGTVGGGLVQFDLRKNKVVKTFTTNGPVGERMFSDVVTDMTYYNDTTLVVTADCVHIVNPKTGKIKMITADDGLPSNTAVSVEKDDNGILWVGMEHGISRLNLKKNVISYYDRRNGIAYDKFSSTSVQELKDGRIVFYTDHNFLVFDPKKFIQETKPINPQITTLNLSGERILLDSVKQRGGVVELSYKNSSISIGFSALSYLLQASVYYYYQMEGVDKNWIRSDKASEAVYNYLPPGNYVFKVKTVNADGVESKNIASILINVHSPFYKTWWFWGLIVLLAIGMLYAINNERQTRKTTLRTMRRNIAGNLHTEIQDALNNINVLSEIARIKADKNIEQSKEFIDQISYKSRNTVQAMDDMLWSIDPQNDSMKKTVLRIRDFTGSLRANSDVEIDLIVDHKVQKLEMDMRFRHELFFFYKEAMQFLLQHTQSRQLFVNINQVRSKLMIEIYYFKKETIY
ncbi:MAG: triple tyrosine motif-containing protein, partial [Bacteroidota bacterium]